MTSLLYTQRMISPTQPDAPAIQASAHAVRRAVRSFAVNIWLAVATATYGGTLLLLRQHPDWSPVAKVTLTLAPLLPGLLYLRGGLFLLRGLDELQRRIQLEAWLFAALGTVGVHTIINVLHLHGLALTWLPGGLAVGGTYLTIFGLWCVGVTIANLRYR